MYLILVFKLSPCSKCNLFLSWVIPRRLSSNCRRFGTHCRFHIHRQVNEECLINSKRGDSHPVHNSNPTCTRTYIHPHPSTTCWTSTRPVQAHYFLLALPLLRSNPTRYKYPTQSIHWHNSFTCLWRWNRQWVPKRRQLELRRLGITQKGTNYTMYLSLKLTFQLIFRQFLCVFVTLATSLKMATYVSRNTLQ